MICYDMVNFMKKFFVISFFFCHNMISFLSRHLIMYIGWNYWQWCFERVITYNWFMFVVCSLAVFLHILRKTRSQRKSYLFVQVTPRSPSRKTEVILMIMHRKKRGKRRVMNMIELWMLTGLTSISRNLWMHTQSNVSGFKPPNNYILVENCLPLVACVWYA